MSERPAILVVEDEALIAFEIKEALEAQGYPVHAVASAEEALVSLQTTVYGAAVLDVRLLDGDSGPVGSALQARDIPWVVFSGCEETDDTVPEHLKARRWIVKPSSTAEVVSAVIDALTYPR